MIKDADILDTHRYGQTVGSWNQYAVDNNMTPEQTQAGLDKLAKGDLPEGANITKVIVNEYKDGVLIASSLFRSGGFSGKSCGRRGNRCNRKRELSVV